MTAETIPDTKYLFWALRSHLRMSYGKPCKKRSAMCPRCIAWQALETLEETLEFENYQVEVDEKGKEIKVVIKKK